MPRNVAHDSSLDAGLAFLSGGGEMGRLIASMDWSSTPLGPIESWGPVLRATVSLCLGSTVPMSIIWGPGRVQVYNDGYRAFCGDKHPGSMGQDYKDCWASTWDTLGDAFARAIEGAPTRIENRRVFVERAGRLEEAFHSFSLSPVRDVGGYVVGLLAVLVDTTRSALSERRQRVLGALAKRTSAPRSLSDALRATSEALAAHDAELPFALFYTLADGEREARLVAATGLEESSPARPRLLAVDSDAVWPFMQALGSSSPVIVSDVAQRLGSAPHGSHPEPPHSALVTALTPAGAPHMRVVLVAGASPRLPLSDDYLGFFELLVSSVAGVIDRVRTEEQRAEGAAGEEGARVRAERALRQAHAALEASNLRLVAEIEQRKDSDASRTELLRQLATAQEDERSRLARDLHDSVGQLVTGLSLALKAVTTAGDLSATSAARIAEVQRVIEALDREVHHIAVQLRPASLDELGLEAAVQDLVSAWSCRTGVRAECAMSLGRARLTHEIETILYRVVQEALTNVAKHARATVVSVVFTRVEGYVTAVVEDDGVGFEPDDAAAGRLGLVGMRERASLAGGEVELESKPGWGTTVLVRIPLPAEHGVVLGGRTLGGIG